MFPYTGSKQIPDIAFDLTELLGSVNREAQIKAERKNVSYAVDWERADLPFSCLLGNPVYATRTIRAMQHEDAETVPIFAMSANCFAEDIVNSRIAGMNEHLTKPLNEKKLLEVIRALIQSTISCLSKNNRYHFVIGVVVEGGDGSLHGFAA